MSPRNQLLLAALFATLAACGPQQAPLPAQLANTSPADGADAIRTDSLISATFTAPLNPDTVNLATLTVRDADGKVIGGEVRGANQKATFTPSQPLLPGSVYTAELSPALETLQGGHLESAHRWSFTTDPAFAVASVSPARGATGVALETPITISFNKPVDPGSVQADAVQVSGLSGTSEVLGNQLRFTPAGGLPLGSDLTIVVSASVKSTAGDDLGRDFTWQVATRDGEWSALKELGVLGDSDGRTPYGLEVLPDGSAVAIWATDYNHGSQSLLTARYTAAAGWSPPTTLSTAATSSSQVYFNPVIAASPQGQITAAWRKKEIDGSVSIRAAQLNSGASSWQPISRLSTLGSPGLPSISVDPQGTAFVAWASYDATTSQSRLVSVRLVQSTWTSEAVLGSSPDNTVATAAVGNGDFIAAYLLGGTASASTYTPALGWDRPSTLQPYTNEATASTPRVASLGGANALSVWEQVGSTGRRLWARAYSPGSQWKDPVYIDDAGSSPALSSNQHGTALLAYAASQQRPTTLIVRQYEPETGWTRLDAVTSSMFPGTPSLALDERGNAMIIWWDPSGLSWSRYRPGHGWSVPRPSPMVCASPTLHVTPQGAFRMLCIGARAGGNSVLLAAQFD